MIIRMADFYHSLVNRDDLQGDGKYTVLEFRKKYLVDFDNEEWWKEKNKVLEIDFEGVTTVGPTWANEAFAYFMKYNVSPERFLKKFIFQNISRIKLGTIKTELEVGYGR